MAEFDIDLNQVKFKPPLQPSTYTFTVVKAGVEQSNTVNKRSGVKEWYIRTELKPMEAPEYVVYHNWSLAQGALEIDDPAISVKALYALMGVPVGQKINTDDFLTFAFSGTTKLEEYNGKPQARLERVLAKVQ